jgi:AraC family transcriptional activator of pobA
MPRTDVPTYELYGEHQLWPTPDLVHCESIADRSRLHDWQIRPHRHHGLLQWLHLRRGRARVVLDDARFDIPGGRVVVVPQLCVHGYEFSAEAQGSVVTLAYPLIDRLGRDAEQAWSALAAPGVYKLGRGADDAHAAMAFAAVAREYRGHAPHRGLLLEAALASILVWLERHAAHSAAERGAQSSGQRHFRRFRQLVEEHYAERWSIERYAAQLGITAAHLNALCRQWAERSALDLVHERIVLEARRSLVYTSMTVSVVSYSLGFADPAYFTRFFKRRVGLSPREFRLRGPGPHSVHAPDVS